MLLARGPFCSLFVVTLPLRLITAEWVDMPQFSDENKIYRIPAVQHDQFYKFRRGDANSNFPDDQRNSSQTLHRPAEATRTRNDKITEIERINSAPEATTQASYLVSDQIADTITEIGEKGDPTITDVVTEDKWSNEYGTISPAKDTIFDTPTTGPPPSSTTRRQTRDEYYNETLKSYDGILQYLPVDILKSVHRTLQSQPVSVEGKLRFLKTFERTLMSEIESRLATTMTPSRKTRGADYGHGYGDHDDHSLGFPSIEGALMAISFLTFAVYLVRLVMLLFRNMNNPMTTTTAATLFLGKRKRSADLDDDTARILSNMNSFVSNF